jgi:mannose-6-phosphate isomerase-like protein (cupin superfamily)
MKKLIGGAAIACLVVLVVAATALATASSGFSTEQLSLGRFDDIDIKTDNVKLKTKGGASDVYVVKNTVMPGGQSGWHYHPGPSLITVVQGTASFYDGDDPTCSPRIFTAGSGVIDDSVDASHVHLLRNEGTVNLVTVTMQIVPAGSPRRVDAPAPATCP